MLFDTKFLTSEMRKRKLTDQDLAFEMLREGVRTSASSISNWRNGKVEPHLTKAAILAKIFGCSIDSFVGGIKN